MITRSRPGQEPRRRDRAAPRDAGPRETAQEATRKAGAVGEKNNISGAGVARHRYARLMQVAITHTYYSGSGPDRPCPDFDARPTPPTQALMRSLGLLFLREEAGFSVLYDEARAEGLFWYLRQHGTPANGGGEEQHWTRLSFALALNDLSFVNFTEIPIDTNPTRQNFYFTNRDAHRASADEIILNKGQWVDGAAVLPVEGPDLRVETPPGVDEVVAFDIAGEPVLTVPRCVPPDASPPARVCRDFVYLDFTTLPPDKYVIEILGTPARRYPILYTVGEPVPLCFIDLLFANPTGSAAGVYPVEHLHPEHKTAIRPRRYLLRFQARSTFWRYYIVPQPQRQELDGLAIETTGGVPPIPFAGPTRVALVNGAPAYRFVSEERLRLQQQSDYRFRLKGRVRRAPAAEDVLVERLSVAASKQVLPEGGPEEPDRNYSDIYVYV